MVALLLLLDFAIPPSDQRLPKQSPPQCKPDDSRHAGRSPKPSTTFYSLEPPPSDASDLLAPVCAIVAETRETPKTYNTIRNNDVALSEVAPGLLPWSAGSLI
jgi:hypothetical protein